MITYTVAGAKDPVTLGNVPAKVKRDLEFGEPAHYALVCRNGRALVGFLRYTFDADGTFCAAGTWVDRKYRKAGVASALWERAIESVKPRKVWVRTVTPGGRALVTALARKYTKVKWSIV